MLLYQSFLSYIIVIDENLRHIMSVDSICIGALDSNFAVWTDTKLRIWQGAGKAVPVIATEGQS